MPELIPYGYTAGTGNFPSYADTRHLCCIAPTRSGKGATVIQQALMLTAKHSVVVNDPKGQNAAVTARRRREMGQDVRVLNPFGLHTEAPWHLPRDRFNPLAALDINHPNIVANVGALSRALILTQGREPYFDDTARDLVGIIMLYLVSTLGKKATLGLVRKMLTQIASRSMEGAAHLVEMGRSPYPFIAQPIGRFKDVEARDISAAMNTAMTQTAFLEDPALTHPQYGTLSASDFDLIQLKERLTTVYLILPGQYMETYSKFLRLLITSALDTITSRPGGLPVLMILDEFPLLKELDCVLNAFNFAAGFNLQLWPFVQNLPELENVYGKRAMSLLANCGLIQFFTPTELHTAEFIQRRGGNRVRYSTGRNFEGTFWKWQTGVSRGESREPLLPIERMMSMPSNQSLVFFAGKHDPLISERVPYWEIARLAGMFDPDPYHMS